MSHRRPPIVLGLFPLVAGFACTSTDPVAQPAQITLSIRPDGVRPRAQVNVDRLGSVCFLNDGAGTTFDVIFEQGFPESMPCSTTLGFVLADGETRTTRPVPFGECAILCFHHSGRYPYRIEGASHALRGVIVVRGGER